MGSSNYLAKQGSILFFKNHTTSMFTLKSSVAEPKLFIYVPEPSIMHLTVSARFLISSGRGENRRGRMGGVGGSGA